MVFSLSTFWFISIACAPFSVVLFLLSLKQQKIWMNMVTLLFVFIAGGLIIVQQYEDYTNFTKSIRKEFSYNAFSTVRSMDFHNLEPTSNNTGSFL